MFLHYLTSVFATFVVKSDCLSGNKPMKILFSKFHGAGNDFVIIDSRNSGIQLSASQIQRLCNRNFGIGADGLILMELSRDGNLVMRYHNADGNEASMCGNGGRCAGAWAVMEGITTSVLTFDASDGKHDAEAELSQNGLYKVRLTMNDVKNFRELEDGFYADTGSPHVVKFVHEPDAVNVLKEGERIRYDQLFQPGGVNVNFAAIEGNRIRLRTYERGVEAETLSCGTGVTAAAIAAMLKTGSDCSEWTMITRGGTLGVYASFNGSFFEDVVLEGPAQFVFKGEINLQDDWKRS
jgi:diaminopimelate epimerase